MQQNQNPINPINPIVPNPPENKNPKRNIIIISFIAAIALIVIIGIILIVLALRNDPKDKNKPRDSLSTKTEQSEKVSEETTKKLESESEDKPTGGMIKVVDGITYVNGILIANKSYSLPPSFTPGVDKQAKKAFDKMAEAAREEGLSLEIVSAFRSYEYQETLYNNYVDRNGKEEADRFSARPGYSEHQTGLAFDVNSLEQSFEDTPEGKWLRENCYKYGFIIRYPKDKEKVTGYMYEPWHIRYLGVDIATALFNSGLCLEEYLGIASVYAEQ